jgi:hypothetical protein
MRTMTEENPSMTTVGERQMARVLGELVAILDAIPEADVPTL